MATTADGTWWQSLRPLVGGTALANLVARSPEEIIAPVLSLFGGLFPRPSVAFVTNWLLVAILLYLFAPLVYSLSVNQTREAPGFRAIFAAAGVTCGIIIKNQLRFEEILVSSPPIVLIASVLAVVHITGGVLLWYLWWVQEWNLLDPYGPVGDLLDLYKPHEDEISNVESILEREGVLGLLGTWGYLLTLTTMLGGPTVLGGILTVIFILAYPFPDLLLLGWVVTATISTRFSIGPTKNQILDIKFDPEQYTMDALENATRSMQGLYLSSLILMGMALAAIYSTLVIKLARLAPLALGLSMNPGHLLLLFRSWIFVGWVLLLFFASGFAFWAWIREWQRLSHFLDQWENREISSEQPVSRPPGLVAFPTISVGFVGILYSLDSIFYAPYSPSASLLAVSWPIVVVGGWWAFRGAVERPPQPVTYENYWIAGGVLTLIFPMILFYSQIDVFWVVILMFVVGYLTVLPQLNRYGKSESGLKRYTTVWLMFGLAGLILAMFPMIPTGYHGWGFFGIAFFLASGILIALSYRYNL